MVWYKEGPIDAIATCSQCHLLCWIQALLYGILSCWIRYSELLNTLLLDKTLQIGKGKSVQIIRQSQ